jgi:COP9 signalosome complex subunit 3
LQAIPLLQNAILRLDPTSSTLTSTHHNFVRLCLYGKAFQAALPILEKTIYHLPANVDKATAARAARYLCSETESSTVYLNPDHGLTQKLTSRDYLEYHLYGAMIYMGLKQWEKAMSFLEIVLVAPTTASTSLIMVEAYKKWVLVGLLLNGKAPLLPKGANKTVIRNIHALARPYDCVVEAFASGHLFRLQGEVEEGQQFWLNDCNFGLVLQVYDAFRKFSVLRLANTYAALPLTEVARRTSPDPLDLVETASYITSLIVSGDLKATLTQPQDTSVPATLRFLSSSSVLQTESDLHRGLQIHRAELESILKHLQDSDHRLEISKDYIEKLRSMKRQKEQEVKAGSSGGQAVADFEEDVMADL